MWSLRATARRLGCAAAAGRAALLPLGACPPVLPAGRGGVAAQGVPWLFIKSYAALLVLRAELVAP